jgi:hypothetical protein
MASEKSDLLLKDLQGQVKYLHRGIEDFLLDTVIEKNCGSSALNSE